MGNIPILQLHDADVRQLRGDSGLSQHQIQRLYARFVYLDRGERGTLLPSDLLRIPELVLNPLRERIIDAIFVECERAHYDECVGDCYDSDSVVRRQHIPNLGHNQRTDEGEVDTVSNRERQCNNANENKRRYSSRKHGINFRQFLHVCSIFMLPKYRRGRIQCEDNRMHKLRFLCHLIDVHGHGCIRRQDFDDLLTQMAKMQYCDDVADAAASLDFAHVLNELFGERTHMSYAELGQLLGSVALETIMTIRIWHTSAKEPRHEDGIAKMDADAVGANNADMAAKRKQS